MSIERAIMIFASIMILISVLLTQFVHANFFWFTVFIGFNMFQQSFTGFCPVKFVFRKLGMKTEKELALA